jgi:hypothetical protein
MSTQNDIACFSLNPYKDYCGSLLEYQHKDGRIELTVELDTETWEFADNLMFFNLYWDKRNPGRISGTKPVQISMYLDPALYKDLSAAGNLLTDKNAFMAAKSDHPMRTITAWFATEVTEEVELPESLKGKGTLREGFTTHWKDAQ